MDILSPYVIVFLLAIVFGICVLASLKGRDFLEKYSGALGVIFAVIAGAFVLVEYENGQNDRRLARTLSYIERIESGSAHESRQWLDLHWIQNRTLIAEIKDANARQDGREDALRLLATYRQSFDESDESYRIGVTHVMRLAYFYSDLAQCVELGLCDALTACRIFANDIGEFYVLHADFIQRWGEVSFERNFQTIKGFLNETCDIG